MENLNKAIEKIGKKEANDIYRSIVNARAEPYENPFWEVIYESVNAIGGYSNGSDVYDDNDVELAIHLFNIQDDEQEDFSLDYDMISSLKENYANHVIGKMDKFDFTGLKSLATLHKDLVEKNIYTGSIEELAAVLVQSSEFANDVWEQLNQPRG